MRLKDVDVKSLRTHCGVPPKIVPEFYPGTKYKMYRICCQECCARTGAKRDIGDAVREWEHPLVVKMN